MSRSSNMASNKLDSEEEIDLEENSNEENQPSSSTMNMERKRAKPHIYYYECDYQGCDQLFTRKWNMKQHVRTHTGETPFICEECGNEFKHSGILKTHRMYKHTKEKNFPCGDCNKRFTTKDNLKTHERVHSGETPLRCDKCTRSFKTHASLKAHRASHEKKLKEK